jgi:hypothetical protein
MEIALEFEKQRRICKSMRLATEARRVHYRRDTVRRGSLDAKTKGLNNGNFSIC